MGRLFVRCCPLVLLALTTLAGAQPLQLVGDRWPPYVDTALVDDGLATAIVRTALGRAGYSTEFSQVPWARAVQGVAEGRYDVLVTVWYNEERAGFGQHSAGYLTNRILFWRKRGAAIEFNRDLSVLKDYPIAVSRGYAYSPAFVAARDLLKVPVRNFAMAAEMLMAGRVALALEDERVGRYVLSQYPQPMQDQVEPLDTPLAEPDLRILVGLKTPGHDAIVRGFNKAIADMKADGTLQSLLGKLSTAPASSPP
jgi:polar amino acid transport system substrate-binding protein